MGELRAAWVPRVPELADGRWPQGTRAQVETASRQLRPDPLPAPTDAPGPSPPPAPPRAQDPPEMRAEALESRQAWGPGCAAALPPCGQGRSGPPSHPHPPSPGPSPSPLALFLPAFPGETWPGTVRRRQTTGEASW